MRLGPEWFTQLVYLTDLLTRVSDVPGDVVECGVADGASLSMLASVLRALGGPYQRRLWGFDAWAGLPAPSEADLAHARSIAVAGMFDHTSMRRVREELAAYGLGGETVNGTIRLVPGYFEQTLPTFDREIAFLHIDADLYESYRCALTQLWPRVKPGGIVAFDEYEDCEQWPGARRAVDEFLGSLPDGAASLQEDPRSGKWWMMKAS